MSLAPDLSSAMPPTLAHEASVYKKPGAKSPPLFTPSMMVFLVPFLICVAALLSAFVPYSSLGSSSSVLVQILASARLPTSPAVVSTPLQLSTPYLPSTPPFRPTPALLPSPVLLFNSSRSSTSLQCVTLFIQPHTASSEHTLSPSQPFSGPSSPPQPYCTGVQPISSMAIPLPDPGIPSIIIATSKSSLKTDGSKSTEASKSSKPKSSKSSTKTKTSVSETRTSKSSTTRKTSKSSTKPRTSQSSTKTSTSETSTKTTTSQSSKTTTSQSSKTTTSQSSKTTTSQSSKTTTSQSSKTTTSQSSKTTTSQSYTSQTSPTSSSASSFSTTNLACLSTPTPSTTDVSSVPTYSSFQTTTTHRPLSSFIEYPYVLTIPPGLLPHTSRVAHSTGSGSLAVSGTSSPTLFQTSSDSSLASMRSGSTSNKNYYCIHDGACVTSHCRYCNVWVCMYCSRLQNVGMWYQHIISFHWSYGPGSLAFPPVYRNPTIPPGATGTRRRNRKSRKSTDWLASIISQNIGDLSREYPLQSGYPPGVSPTYRDYITAPPEQEMNEYYSRQFHTTRDSE